MEEIRYESECARHDVAIRSIFLLFRWGKRSLLREVGIEPEKVWSRLEEFSDHLPGKYITTEEDTFKLCRAVPEVVGAAVSMVGTYQVMLKERASG